MRVSSPPPNKANGRGSSLGPAKTSTPPRRAGQRTSNLTSVHELTGVERPESRGSVNFSYPTSSRPTSPMFQKRLTSPSPSRTNLTRITSPTNQNLVYDPNTRSFLPYADILAIEQRIQDAAKQTVKKKKRISSAQATGTHLAEGTVGGRPRGTAVDAIEAAAREDRNGEPSPIPTSPSTTKSVSANDHTVPTTSGDVSSHSTPSKKKKKRVALASDSDSDRGSYVPNLSDSDSDFPPATFNTRAGALLAKRPSIVREDREAEEEEDEPKPADLPLDNIARTVSPSPLPRSTVGKSHGRGQASASAAYAKERQHTRSASQPAPSPQTSTTPEKNGTQGKGSARGSRVQSVSPARTTHFASTTDSLSVKHQPPPRSVSPRKSALKQSNSPREPSPIGDLPGSVGLSKRLSISEASNASTVESEDLPLPRKKAVRVSFDESNVLVGEAAPQPTTDSPIAPSPQQAKRGWFSIGRGKKKDAMSSEAEDDEIMKPRPALPSFGSVRERKHAREPVEERQLVKPAEPVETIDSTAPAAAVPASVPHTPASPLFTSPVGDAFEFPMGQSNDHIVGAIISHDAASKNAANISRSREPLPPQVLSVEGSGYHSDSDSTVPGLDNLGAPDLGVQATSHTSPGLANEQVEVHEAPDAIDEKSTPRKISDDIPEISISHPTPTLDESDDRREWPDMPGGFPGGSSTSDSGSHREASDIVEHHPTDQTPAAIGIAEPYEEPQPGSPALGEIAAENHIRHSTIEEETEDESIYSDAAEDFSDAEGDGFMSLDAVVDSPIVPSAVPGLAITTPPESPTARSTKEKVYKKSQLSRKSSEPELEEGWEKAQEYWRSLSADKKSQLEQEARGEAEDSDATIEATPLPKPKKKKVKAKPPPVVVPAQKQPDRTYMIQPGSKAQQDGYAPVIRSSMRAAPPEDPSETHIRKSMRGQGSMRASLRGNEHVEARATSQKNKRPTSLPGSQIKADPVAVNMHVRALSVASAAIAPAAARRDMAAPKPSLRRKNSGDSDSSFKRTRPVEGSHFRSSMRRGSIDKPTEGRQRSPMRSGRFSLRSLSPTGSTSSRLPFNTPQAASQTHMRSSMRSSYNSAPTLRGNKAERAKSPVRIPGFGRSSSSKPVKQKPIRQRVSRFADSSDEDEAPRAFSSRFVDSSDDDDEPVPRPGGMRGSMRTTQPVRSIPRRAGLANGDGDSSDLPDSDDEKTPVSPAVKLAKTRANGNVNSNQGLNLATGSLRRSGSGRNTLASPTIDASNAFSRPKQNRRGSFMSILRRKKDDPSSKVRKSDIESAARRDTPLERSRSDLQAIRRNDSYQSTNGKITSSPKLQKRNNSSSWPLPHVEPPKPLGDNDGRPYTADDGDGVVGGGLTNGNGGGVARPDLGTRRFTATGAGDMDLTAARGQGRKKKKFQKLRNLFGLDD